VSFSRETLVLELAESIENGCSRKRLDKVECRVFFREIAELSLVGRPIPKEFFVSGRFSAALLAKARSVGTKRQQAEGGLQNLGRDLPRMKPRGIAKCSNPGRPAATDDADLVGVLFIEPCSASQTWQA
jgi:hypothetical protein